MNPPILTTRPPAQAPGPETLAEPAPEEAEWRVACHDPYGRDRAVAVLVEDDTVLLVPPPGQAAVLSGSELDRLCHALTAAERTAVPGRSTPGTESAQRS